MQLACLCQEKVYHLGEWMRNFHGAARRQLALKYHPDKAAGPGQREAADKLFKLISGAHRRAVQRGASGGTTTWRRCVGRCRCRGPAACSEAWELLWRHLQVPCQQQNAGGHAAASQGRCLHHNIIP